jgi:hypothetical protein
MRAHGKLLAAILATASVLMACAADEANEASSEDDIRTKKIDAAEAEALFDKVDENCAGNDNGGFSRFDVRTFDAAKVMEEVQKEDKDAMGVGCHGDHAYSKSRASAVALFNEHLNANEFDDRSCLEEHMSSKEIARLKQMVADPTNLGVFASVYDGHGDGNSEACAFYIFHVYRADGTHVELQFNHTD